jgi:tRNA (guanine37-N1)-methyltransferase
MRIDVVSIFPEYLAPLELSLIGKARQDGILDLHVHDLRSFTTDKHRSVDDTPYGGGAGMVLRVDVVDAALSAAYADGREPSRILVLSPSGRQLDDELAGKLAGEPHVALLSARYEGIDERVREHLATDAVSIGPYVLSGGELAAMVVADAIIRKLPGALGHADSAVEESFSEALGGAPEYPHFTRPASYRGWKVPEVLRSGDHARVREWRLQQSRRRGGAIDA